MDPRLTAPSGYEYLARNRGDISSGTENQWETLIRENQRLTRRVAILEKNGNTRENFESFTKEIDRLNALVVVREAEIQELVKKNDQKENWQEKSAKMKGHIKSLEKKLKETNDFRFEITEEMESLLEENVNPNQTMCINMARKTSEYHKELWRKVRFNFEHMRRANSGLQTSLEELEVEKEDMEFEHGRRNIAIQEYKIKLKAADKRIQDLEGAIILKDQNVLNLTKKVNKLEVSLEEKEKNEVQMRYDNSEMSKKFWDQTAQVEALIQMLEDKTVRIVGDTMEQQRHIQSLEQQKSLENIKPSVQDLAAKMDRNAGLIKKDMENRLDAQDQKVKKLENSAKLLMQEVFCLRFNYKESSEEVQKLRNRTSELEKMLSDAVEEEERTHLAKMAKWRAAGIKSLKRKREEE
ncbi:unnamed protein product [Caenorhabditis nigoni]